MKFKVTRITKAVIIKDVKKSINTGTLCYLYPGFALLVCLENERLVDLAQSALGSNDFLSWLTEFVDLSCLFSLNICQCYLLILVVLLDKLY